MRTRPCSRSRWDNTSAAPARSSTSSSSGPTTGTSSERSERAYTCDREAVMDKTNGTASANGSSPDPSDDREVQLARAWEILDQVAGRNAHKDPDEILAEVTAEVEAVRQERYERREAAK